MTHDAISAAFYEDLIAHRDLRHSGVFFITTDKNRAITLALTDGWITYFRGYRQHGQLAVEQLANATIVKYAFNEGGDYPFRSRDEVVHQAVLDVLEPALKKTPHSTPQADTNTHETVTHKTRIYRGQRIQD